MARLDREPRAGYLGAARLRGRRKPGPVAWFSAVRVSPEAPPLDASLVPPAPKDPPGVIKAWAVSEALPAPRLRPTLPLPDATRRLGLPRGRRRAGRPGLPAPPRQDSARTRRSWATAARLHLRADKAGPRRLDLGFSDTATVYLNGAALAHLDAAYSFDNPRQEGLVHLGQSSLFLPLRAGDNELLVVVSDVFGGWAVMGRFPDDRGLRVEAR